jgi:hypothetical protein
MGMTGRVATRPRFKSQARGRGFRAANVMRRNRAGSTAPARAQSAIWPELAEISSIGGLSASEGSSGAARQAAKVGAFRPYRHAIRPSQDDRVSSRKGRGAMGRCRAPISGEPRAIPPARRAAQPPASQENAQVSVDDAFRGENFVELAVVGWPAHAFRFGDVVANAARSFEFAAQFEGAPQSAIVGRFALRAVGESVSLARREGEGAVRQIQFRCSPFRPRADEPPSPTAERLSRRLELDPIVCCCPWESRQWPRASKPLPGLLEVVSR